MLLKEGPLSHMDLALGLCINKLILTQFYYLHTVFFIVHTHNLNFL